MADDELLVNFHLDTALPARKQNFKGGTWKDRLTARKSAEYNRQKAARKHEEDITVDTPSNNQTALDGSGARPVKRQRVEERGKPAGQSSQHAVSKTPRQVVSSLFSFNPTSKSGEDGSKSRNVEDETETQPSNAPLKDQLETFTSLGLSPELSEFLLNKLEITAPTAIQRHAVKQLVSNDTDAFIQAQTGSGKTLAYLLPIVQRLVNLSMNGSKLHRNSGLFAIVLAPTRELSKQISNVLESLLRYAHWLVSGTVIGGEKKKSEKARLRKGLNILIATPGRLVDHLDNTEVLDVSNVRWLVLDEGDRLMELGFDQDIQKILSILNLRASGKSDVEGLPSKRTTVLCSATMKMNVQKLGDISLKDAVHIQAESTESNTNGEAESNGDGFSAPAQLHQSYVVVPAKLRLVALTALLRRTFARKGSVMKAIIFMTCADSVDFHFDIFGKQTAETTPDQPKDTEEPVSKRDAQLRSFRTRSHATEISTEDNPVHIFRLHGSLPQIVRTATLLAFRKSKEPSFLVCTDVAARGLDLPNVDLVVEYDPPFQKEDHLHRIGRTARAGKDGRASIFLQPGSEEGYVNVLKSLRHEGGREPRETHVNELLKRGFGSSKLGGKDWEEQATQWQLDIERRVVDDLKLLELARQAYQSHIRAYATHVASERHMFDMTSLHLGHLAKAFALRDKPGSIRVPGLRPTSQDGNAVKAERRSQARKDASGLNIPKEDIPSATDTAEASKKMRQKLKQQSGASEFNLG